MPDFVFLTDEEGKMAAMIGVERHIQSRRKCYQNRHGAKPEEGWQMDIEGACGEIVIAKYLNRHWSGPVGNFKKGDVGEEQVRTANESWHNLIVRPDDNPEQRFWLVIGQYPNYWVHGYIKAGDAQREEWWSDRGGRDWAWFVPKEALSLEPVV